MNSGDVILSAILWLVLIALYFLPTMIAMLRHHHNVIPIFLLNLFLGWTMIAWIVVLAMAFSNPAPTYRA